MAASSGNYGNLVVMVRADGLQTWYGHLSGFAVRAGEAVEAGEMIGCVGSTGRSTGSHLHFEVRPGGGIPVDPLGFWRQEATYT